MRRWFLLIIAIGLSVALGLDASAAPLTPAAKTQLLDDHNQARDDVANGLQGAQPSAADMTKLVWDDKLEQVAQSWANSCTADYNANRLSQYQALGGAATAVGENLYFTTESVGVPDIAMNAWLAQADSYTFGPITASDATTAGNFLQIAWAGTTRVGCAQATCPGLFGGFGGEALICNYAESGLYIAEEPYDDGPPASNCPVSHPLVENGLCVALPDPPPPTTIQLTSGAGVSAWYYTVSPSYHDVAIVKVEVLHDGVWYDMPDVGGGVHQISPSEGIVSPLSVPLSFRLTSVLGEVLTAMDLVSSLSPNTTWDFGQQFQSCGDGIVDAGEECDDGNAASGDGCWSTCENEDEFVLYGTAAGGGSVEVHFGGAATGQSAIANTVAATPASQAITDLAADANSNATLQGLGVSALALGNRLVTNGVIDSYSITDAGLTDSPPPPPTTIHLTVGPSASVWFITLSAAYNDADITNIEAFHDGTWLQLNNVGSGVYRLSTTEGVVSPLAVPLSIRVTSTFGETLTMTSLITNLTANSVWDTGQQFTVPVCGNAIVEILEECDDGNTTVGDGCYSTCEFEDSFTLYGTSLEGGFVQLGFGAPSNEFIFVSTSPGDTATEVLDALVGESNNDPTHQNLGIAATRVGNRFVTNGVIASSTIGDPDLGSALCGNSIIDDGETCDDGNTTIGDGCYSTCEVEDSFALYGASLEGGFVQLEFGAPSNQFIFVSTSPGDTAVQVLDALVDESNDDATHQGLGISAARVGNRFVTNGVIASSTIGDPDLFSVAPPVPAVSAPGWIALALLLGIGGGWVAREHGRRAVPLK